MILCGTKRIQSIIAIKSNLNFELLNLRQKLMDMQSYAASIGDGIISPEEMMNAPASMFGALTGFAMTSHQTAFAMASQNIGVVMTMNQQNFAQISPEYKQMYENMIFKNLYDQQREKLAQAENKKLDAEETKIQQRIAQLETQLQMLTKEEEETRKIVEKEAGDSAPKYA